MKSLSQAVLCRSGLQLNLSTGRFVVVVTISRDPPRGGLMSWRGHDAETSQLRVLRVATFSASEKLQRKTNGRVAQRPHGLDLESGGFPYLAEGQLVRWHFDLSPGNVVLSVFRNSGIFNSMLSLLCREAIYYISSFTSTLHLLLLTTIPDSPAVSPAFVPSAGY